VTLVKVKQ